MAPMIKWDKQEKCFIDQWGNRSVALSTYRLLQEKFVRVTRKMKLTVPEVFPLAQHIYNRNVVGCCLHIVLDDGNYKDDHVQECIERAQRLGHGDCETLARLLLRMTKTQRSRVAHRLR